MEVSEIKEFINNKQEEMYYADRGDYFIPPNDVGEILEVILNMLDELEDRPKAKWEETNCSTEYFGKLSRCSKCGYETFPQDDTNYCGGCGTRMNDELEENNK